MLQEIAQGQDLTSPSHGPQIQHLLNNKQRKEIKEKGISGKSWILLLKILKLVPKDLELRGKERKAYPTERGSKVGSPR
eukprot:2038220-Prorocentrum_lima.AAC.1